MKIFARLDDGRELEFAGSVGSLPKDAVIILQITGMDTMPSPGDLDTIHEHLTQALFPGDTAPTEPIPIVFLPSWIHYQAYMVPKDKNMLLTLTVPEGKTVEEAVEHSYGVLPSNVGHIAIVEGTKVEFFARHEEAGQGDEVPSEIPVQEAPTPVEPPLPGSDEDLRPPDSM